MRFIILLILLCGTALQAQPKFSEYFHPKALRIDYQHAGDSLSDQYSVEEFIEEPYWAGNPSSLIDPFNYGKYKVEVRDSASGELIYSKTYSTLFSEWQTTAEAKRVRKSFPESVVIPFPKKKVMVTFFSRDRKNLLHGKLSFALDPASYFIKKDRRSQFPNFKVHYSGDPANKVDIVILPEGYTKDEMEQFKADCKKFSSYLFNASPFKENERKFNVWGVEAPSIEAGTDIPKDDVWKRTLMNTSFYTFDVERYCMTTDYKSVRDLAANAPCDAIYILVNSTKYGGGAIYNYYAICVNKNAHEEYIFAHEFGHSFASLGDEYYESATAYEEFYAPDVEPTDPNLTTLVDADLKWKKFVKPGTPIPTPATDDNKKSVGAFEGGG
jgi:hypothetical protein